MTIRLVTSGESAAKKYTLGILALVEDDLGKGLPGAEFFGKDLLHEAAAAVRIEGFAARSGQVFTLYFGDSARVSCLMLVGLGSQEHVSPETLRQALGNAARRVPRGLKKRDSAAVFLDGRHSPWLSGKKGGSVAKRSGKSRGGVDPVSSLVSALVEGWHLGGYTHTNFQTENSASRLPDLSIVTSKALSGKAAALRGAVRRAESIADGVKLARDLANAPANDLNPLSLARRARALARGTGLSVKILDEAAIRREKMGALIGVAQGSDIPPRFIVLRYQPRSKSAARRPLVLVGKAVTFDSGGLSIKPAKGMEEMKMDMSGGAAVLAAMTVIARLKPSTGVIGLIPCAENMINGRATRPGDVLSSRAGLTIEVTNTDAEGRLILADALDYARQFNPRMVVDLATLTGACVVALGDLVTGFFVNDAQVGDALRSAAETSGEKFWELPLQAEYAEALKSDTADIKNSGGRSAGAITAAVFLSRFIDGVPWAHVDIAGPAWSSRQSGYRTKGATGFGVRTLVELALASS